MKVLIAGATGAIGGPLIRFLNEKGYEIYGISHSEERAQTLLEQGAHPIVLNILDRDAVFSALAKVKPQIVIDMLTHLPKEYTPESMKKAAEIDAKVRLEGGSNLQAAAELNGVMRYIVQSSGFWYAPGEGLADETVSFAFHASPGIAAGTNVYQSIEDRVLKSKAIEGVALRFGFFYGPGTWFNPDGNMADQIHKQQFPIIGNGGGVWNFIHIEDAAKSIVSTIECPPGAYNIVNNTPVEMRIWLPSFARFLKAPMPTTLSVEEGLEKRGADSVYYATKLRGASNEKAKHTFNFSPWPLEWLD